VRFWLRTLPLVATLVVVLIPVVRYAAKMYAEAAGRRFVEDVQLAQEAFLRAGGHGAYATDLRSLTTACEGHDAALSADAPRALDGLGYAIQLRAAEGAAAGRSDCHGRPTATDYYVGVQPAANDTAAQQAVAATGRSGMFVFFDGIAPLERDMAPGGLATPAKDLRAFQIP
jgi:hypothetical protein